ncbi:hypothetical protein SK128_013472 [Halocaridina rubra]|uniref:G-protein coupled receptors family 1 profile domain-containing protein n=1 Tax=Halocaridina rubra TaxID=373956 RepID=A0AAN9A036_HALRR
MEDTSLCVTYTYFLVLAISDLLSLFFSISMLIHLTKVGTRLHSTAVWYSYCELPIINSPMSASIFIIVCITIDRYFSVCRPTDFKKIHTSRYAWIGIIGAIVTAIIIWFPSCLLKEPKYYKDCASTSFVAPDEGTWWVSCMKVEIRNSTWYITYSWIRQSIMIFIPVIILVILNSLIVREFILLRRKKKALLGTDQPKDSPSTDKKTKENHHLIRLLTAVMISFTLTIIPSGIFGALYNEELSSQFQYEMFRALANDLEILNHALNFYLYILYSKPIREAIKNIFQDQHKRIENMAISNIIVVIQKTKHPRKRASSPTSDSSPQPQPTLREMGQETSKPQRDKSKTASQETQPTDASTSESSDSESSFNGIVYANTAPASENLKAPYRVERTVSDPMDSRVYLGNTAPYKGDENVYLKAVEKRNNKPPNGLHTIVHTAEVHTTQDPEINDQYNSKRISDDSQPEVVHVKRNGILLNTSKEEVSSNVIIDSTAVLTHETRYGGLANLAFEHEEVMELQNKARVRNGDINAPEAVKTYFPTPPVKASFLMKTPFNDTLDPRIELTREVAYTIVAPIIVSVGIFGNLLTILILRLPQFRGVTYTYFLVLAISDLLSLFFSISMLIHLTKVGTRLHSTAVWYSYCELPIINSPMSASIFIIVCITIDRYFSVCRPTDFKKIHTSRYAWIGIIGAIVTAIIIWFPSCLLKEPKYYKDCASTSFVAPDEGTWWVSCMKVEIRNSTWYITYSWIRQSIMIFIPVIILVILNSLIVREFILLRRKKKALLGTDQPKDSPSTDKKTKENHHLIRLLTAVMISFTLTIIPSGIFGALYNEELSSQFQYEMFRALANDLEILNHALNFYLYILYSKPIREAIKNIFQDQHKRIENMAISNIIVVIQKTKHPRKRASSPTSDSSPQPQPTLREMGQETSKPQRDKSKTASQETQPTDASTSESSDSESSFNGIVYANTAPASENLKAPYRVERTVSDPMDSRVYLGNTAPYKGDENVYLKAVEKRNNKPPNGLHTIVHTAEVHTTQDPEINDQYNSERISDDSQPEVVHVKRNGILLNTSKEEVSSNVIIDSTAVLTHETRYGGLANLAFEHEEVMELQNKARVRNGDINAPEAVKTCKLN